MNLKASWVLQTDPSVLKQLKKISRKDAERILFTIESMAFGPYQGDIQKMKGEKDTWRRRIGSYRIFYEIFQKERIVVVFKIQRRTSHTY